MNPHFLVWYSRARCEQSFVLRQNFAAQAAIDDDRHRLVDGYCAHLSVFRRRACISSRNDQVLPPSSLTSSRHRKFVAVISEKIQRAGFPDGLVPSCTISSPCCRATNTLRL